MFLCSMNIQDILYIPKKILSNVKLGADPTLKDDGGHTADEYTENESVKKLIMANKEEVRLESNYRGNPREKSVYRSAAVHV